MSKDLWQTCIGSDGRGVQDESQSGLGIITDRADGEPNDVIVDGGLFEGAAEAIVRAHNEGIILSPPRTEPSEKQRLIRRNIDDAHAVFRRTMEFVDKLDSGYTADSGVPAGLLDTAMRALEHVGLMAKEVAD